MGRRKIEIQPITHERNRSVTFLKRKNGLFKKAYELGVLCSVDVAVIIFEERPGHHVKLYQYCSTDVNSMVQRHLRFDGEKDTRVPSDFNNKQAEEAADDDDEADDDSPKRQNVSGTSKTGAGKVKSEGSSNGTVPIRPVPTSTNESSMTIDLEYRTRVSPTSTPTSTLPVSGERHTALRAAPGMHKRPRLDDGAQTPSMQLPPSYPYRLELDMSQYPVQSHITPLPSLPPAHGVTHPSLQYPHTHVPSVTGMMGGGGSGAGFLPQLPQAPFDLSAHQGGPPPTLRSVSFSPGSYASQGMYRTQPQMQMQGAAGMAVELLEGAGAQGGAQQFAPFDWPVHNAQSQESSHPSSATESSSNWFDFLSGGTNTSSAQASNLFPSHARGSLSSRSFAESPGAGLKRVREEDAGSMSMNSDIGGDGNDKPGGGGMERRSVSVHTPPS